VSGDVAVERAGDESPGPASDDAARPAPAKLPEAPRPDL
jgi:hypothetical protein